MSEQTRNVDGFIQTLVSIGGQIECIASEGKHPKPEITEEDELKRAIQGMPNLIQRIEMQEVEKKIGGEKKR